MNSYIYTLSTYAKNLLVKKKINLTNPRSIFGYHVFNAFVLVVKNF